MERYEETEYNAPGNPSAMQTLPPDEKLKPAEKLRLRYLTGQDEDPNAPVDHSHFYGGGMKTRGARGSDD